VAHTNDRAEPTELLTLAIDIGGSHLKAAVLNASGKMSTDPVRVKTTEPATPDAVVATLISLSQQLGQFDRVSIGFPGVVRADFNRRCRRPIKKDSVGTMPRHGGRSAHLPARRERAPSSAMRDR
jgi:predicted NBD/HSP70 family sugar kinase